MDDVEEGGCQRLDRRQFRVVPEPVQDSDWHPSVYAVDTGGQGAGEAVLPGTAEDGYR